MPATIHLKPPLKGRIKQPLRLTTNTSPSRLVPEPATAPSNQSTRKGSHFSCLSQTQATAISKLGLKSAEFMIPKESSSSNKKQ